MRIGFLYVPAFTAGLAAGLCGGIAFAQDSRDVAVPQRPGAAATGGDAFRPDWAGRPRLNDPDAPRRGGPAPALRSGAGDCRYYQANDRRGARCRK